MSATRRCNSQQRDVAGGLWLWRRAKPWPDPVTRHRCCCCCCSGWAARRGCWYIRRWTVSVEDAGAVLTGAHGLVRSVNRSSSTGRSVVRRRDSAARKTRQSTQRRRVVVICLSARLVARLMADCPRAKWSWLLHAASTRAAESIARLSAEATRVDYLNIAEFERNVLLTCNGVRISWWWVVQSSSSSSSLLVSFQLSHLTSVSKHISQGGAKGGQWPLQDVQKYFFRQISIFSAQNLAWQAYSGHAGVRSAPNRAAHYKTNSWLRLWVNAIHSLLCMLPKSSLNCTLHVWPVCQGL